MMKQTQYQLQTFLQVMLIILSVILVISCVFIHSKQKNIESNVTHLDTEMAKALTIIQNYGRAEIDKLRKKTRKT